MFTGGSYNALALVSSNVFGLKILSSGLTQFELKQLSNIKVFGTIVLENVPQLMLQLLYASERGIGPAVGIAFFASILSVIATLLSYLIDRNGNEVKPVQYYLTIQCQRVTAKQDINKDVDDLVDGPLTIRSHVSHRDITLGEKLASLESPASSNTNQLTENETLNIMNNKGRTEFLGESLAALFETQPKNIEVGSTLCHKTGATIHIVHMVYQTELDIMQQELDEDGITINPYFYAQQLFISLQKEITELLLTHFKLNNNDFAVLYDDFAGLKKRKMTRGMIMNNGRVSNAKLLQKMLTQAKLNANANENAEDRVKSVLKGYLNEGIGEYKFKKNQLYEMINNLDAEITNGNDMDDESSCLSVIQELEPNDANATVEMTEFKTRMTANVNTLDIVNIGELDDESDDNEDSASNRL